MNSKQKGCRGEREAAAALAKAFPGTEARRGQQFSGGPDSPDVHWLPEIHVEVKRCEALRLWPAIEQARRDCGDRTPILLHRANGRPWVVVIELDDLPTSPAHWHRWSRKEDGCFESQHTHRRSAAR
jgi:hypothetical protein